MSNLTKQAFLLVRGYDNEATFIGVFTDENDIIPAVIEYCYEDYDGIFYFLFPDDSEEFYDSLDTIEKFKETILERFNTEEDFWVYLKSDMDFFYENIPLYTKN